MMRNILKGITLIVVSTLQLTGGDSLRLVHPNGGESIQAGKSITIRWEGVEDTTKVKLEFSSDNGKSWNEITDQATNLSYEWEVPQLESDNCLITIKQDNFHEVNLEWQKSFGGTVDEEAHSIIQTKDSGYMIAGQGWSSDGDITNPKGGLDYWILKLSENGELEWQKSFGGSQHDIANSIIQTLDNGYLIAGYSESVDGDVTNPKRGWWSDFWILKLKVDGELEWQKSFGGSKGDVANSIVQTLDNGYIIAGYSASVDGDITSPHGMTDYWIVKLKEDGSLEWQKSFGGTEDEEAHSIIQTKDSGYIIAGYSRSKDGDITSPKGRWDYWIIKLKEDGSLEWQKSFGGTEDDYTESIIQTQDKGYLIAGSSMSTDGDITNPKGGWDCWIIKLKEDGSLEWQKSFGGSHFDVARSIIQTQDKGYLIAGSSMSTDGGITNLKGDRDYWILKLKEDGSLEWQKSFGGSKMDEATSLVQTLDGDYVVVGQSGSRDGDITNPKGRWDYWVLKLVDSIVSRSDTSNAVFSIFIPEENDEDGKFDYYLSHNEENNFAVATIVLKEKTYITLELYNILGKRIIELYSGEANKGKNKYRFEYDDFYLSKNYITGRYFVKLTTPTITKAEILELIK